MTGTGSMGVGRRSAHADRRKGVPRFAILALAQKNSRKSKICMGTHLANDELDVQKECES